VDTGSTLRANRLKAVEEILAVSARLIVNPASMKVKRPEVLPLIEAIERASRG
jgi:ATP phosphoribosyltransferase